MYSAIIFLVLASAAYAADPDKCVTVQTGELEGTKIVLDRLILDKPLPKWTVTIPKICDSQGVVATICDYDKVPTAKILDEETIRVLRTGELKSPATVDITVHCVNTRRDKKRITVHWHKKG